MPRTTRLATSPSRRQGRLDPARSFAMGHLEVRSLDVGVGVKVRVRVSIGAEGFSGVC